MMIVKSAEERSEIEQLRDENEVLRAKLENAYLPKTNEKPDPDLTNKCGSCKHSVVAENVFGKSRSYIKCTHPENMARRLWQEYPMRAVRQRTAAACKKYEARTEG